MKVNKKIGIYLNYQIANIIDYKTNTIEQIASEFKHQDKIETLQKGEKAMHHKEHNEHLAYFKKICEVIKHYDEAILFGPTKAKDELHNLIRENTHFNKIDVQIENKDNLTEKEQQTFVQNYFSKKLSTPSL